MHVHARVIGRFEETRAIFGRRDGNCHQPERPFRSALADPAAMRYFVIDPS